MAKHNNLARIKSVFITFFGIRFSSNFTKPSQSMITLLLRQTILLFNFDGHMTPLEHHAWRNQRITSGIVALFPYINIPMRYIRAAIQRSSRTGRTRRRSERPICHVGGGCATILTSIVIGEKNGNIETQKANDEFGLRITVNPKYSPATSVNTTGIANWPPSCAVVTMDPINTYTVA